MNQPQQEAVMRHRYAVYLPTLKPLVSEVLIEADLDEEKQEVLLKATAVVAVELDRLLMPVRGLLFDQLSELAFGTHIPKGKLEKCFSLDAINAWVGETAAMLKDKGVQAAYEKLNASDITGLPISLVALHATHTLSAYNTGIPYELMAGQLGLTPNHVMADSVRLSINNPLAMLALDLSTDVSSKYKPMVDSFIAHCRLVRKQATKETGLF